MPICSAGWGVRRNISRSRGFQRQWPCVRPLQCCAAPRPALFQGPLVLYGIIASVKIKERHFASRTHWLPYPIGGGDYRPWLIHPGSLTQRLRDCCQEFSVSQVGQRQGHPYRDEAGLLGMRAGDRAILRDVYLHCDSAPVVFAHSVLPFSSLQGPWHGLDQLGTRPLGESLFANPAVVRTPLVFCKLGTHHELYRQAVSVLKDKPRSLWARRSVFSLKGAPILVTEVFLPEVLKR
jgi:chorismate--pyruvate lyase